MKIHLQGTYKKMAEENEFFALKFAVDFPPLPVQSDENGPFIFGTEEHLRRLEKHGLGKLIPEPKEGKGRSKQSQAVA